ncbi:efflux RND transporter periplasmic adaptor subunit [Pelagicoccus sp. SDUM812003]|uniref:efflux RND transporter periplasmic adaptor subunit n=1 Tax=Pelagicoccus sp. SDUM812003 TaxID=3041267 RepID=UPI00280EEB46|nr:efflux RND transporter periplasmic adaptor subunit [Pelagicoccus sp. SDUM812003]MDQ8204622.1 efflux RND transporter periplasmic adaptor subunit [Pelagicoccus sp. SDUM812003]
MSRWVTGLICLAVLALAAGVTTVIFFTEPTAQREGATKRTAMLVEVQTVQRGDYKPVIAAMGTVEPAEEVMLSPRVSGEVLERSPVFTPGGVAEKGEMLIRIDAADYEAALAERRSELQQAEADLNIEMGRQSIAEDDFELLGEDLNSERRSLVLREPQLQTAQARVEAAQAAVRRAELDLQRTEVKAPFDAQVLTREVTVGSQVGPGDTLGHLVGRDRYWVATAVPLSKLRWIEFGEGEDGQPAKARVRNRAAWPEGVYREGEVYQLVGTLESATRMARVLVEVPDPLGDRVVSSDKPVLMIGAFVEVLINARPIENVVRVDRDYVRQGATVWVMDEEDALRIRKVDIEFQDEQYAYVSEGLEDGDRVVTTNLATPIDGSPLRLEGEETVSDEASESGEDR